LPDELRLFIGNETSRTGIELIFDALQNPHLNRRLTYVLLERLLSTVFPNNRFGRVLPLLHSKSPRVRDDHDGGGGGG
jgi:sorting nexin-13